MKAEITQENKAKFFALYWGQLIGLDQEKGEKPCYVLAGNNIQYAETIELKPLSQISDEDAIEVARIFDPNKEEGDWEQILKYKSMFDDLIDPDNIAERLPFTAISNVFDFLRSRGYALPWMGLSVDELIKAGWIRLV